MRGHVVGTFDRVDEGLVFGDQTIQRRFHIGSDIRVCIFIDRQARRGVLQENLQDPNSNVLEFGDCRDDLACNQVKAASVRTNPDGFLGPKHSELFSLCIRLKAAAFGWRFG